MCFSLAEPDTLTNVRENWSPEIRHFCGNVPVILVGNKKDLRDEQLSQRTPSATSLLSSSHPSTPMSTATAKSTAALTSGSLLNSAEPSTKTDTSCNDKDHNDNGDDIANSNNTNTSINTPKLDDSENINISTSNSGTTTGQPSYRYRSKSEDIETNRPSLSSSSAIQFSTLTRPRFRVQAPVKHSEGVFTAKRIGAMAYFETSALNGLNVEELLLATTKAAVLGTKKCKKFKPFTDTLRSWRSSDALSVN